MKITRVHPLLTIGLESIGALFILLCVAGCGGGSASTKQEDALLELVSVSQGRQAKLLDLSSANIRSAILDLLAQAGESAEQSPMLYQRLLEELNEDGADLNGRAEASAGIDEATRSSSGEVFVNSFFESHDKHVYVLFLHAFLDAGGRILGAPERQEFFVPEGRLEVSSSSYSDDLSHEITTLSIFAIENRPGQFSLYTATLNTPSMPSSGSSTVTSEQGIAGGSLVAGSKVMRADGSLIPIEKVTAGTTVRINLNGGTGTVQQIVSGYMENVFVIITEDGLTLEATGAHPILTDKGLKRVSDIRQDSSFSTINGVSKAPWPSPYLKSYRGQVYNLSLAKNPAINTPTFVANGFVVGDLVAQSSLSIAPQQLPDDVILGRLPKEWHADFLSSKSGS